MPNSAGFANPFGKLEPCARVLPCCDHGLAVSQEGVLRVGDPRRMALGRAAVGTLLAAALFMAFTLASKEIRPFSSRAPWQDDPYDAAVSFAFSFVPLLAAVLLVRILRCRRDQALPVQRVSLVLRGSRLALVAMLITLLADWTSVALRADQSAWNATTALLVGMLALVTAGAAKVSIDLRRASKLLPRRASSPLREPDWLDDLVAVGRQYSFWLGPLKTAGLRILSWLELREFSAVRSHPVAVAAALSLVFGLALAANTSLAEGFGPGVWLDITVGASAMFAFSVAAGSHLALVRSVRPSFGRPRRLADAAVIGCASVPVALAFRDSLWWLIGVNQGAARAGHLLGLLLIVGVTTFFVVFAAESLVRAHGRSAAGSRS